ncbi:hypothetical protein F511_14848 [Dorcoceras hygrometricum]|uniref:Integrase catalytic domain-containing protein n=1 Tax=Dorcoceras hygrometricum TaxID=472368 RepID=A0A2Z7D1Z7_9LAMI|nr:hypothetical protein F511_14848 [Dorcoceras hygrometricum]
MEPNISHRYLWFKTANEVWDAVHCMYFELGNASQLLPTAIFGEVFAEVRREEGRRKIMLSSKLSPTTETSAMVSKHFTPTVPNRQPKKAAVVCEHCQKPWHTADTCWDLHGKPPNWKPKSVRQKGGSGSRAYQSGLDEHINTEKSSGTASFSKEQIDQLYKLFQSTSFSPSVPGSCSIATKGTYLQSVGFNVSTITICPWIIDSGATDHMTGSSKLFHSYIPCAGNQKIKIADGTLSAIAGQGTIVISQTITLHNVLHVPNLSCNLLSISKLTRDLKCTAQFSSNLCVFQELDSGKTIGSAKEAGGLYYFGDESHSCGQAQQYSIAPISSSSTNEIFLWHRRMGHPNFQYLKHLYPQLFHNQNVSDFQCDICQFAKHHRSSFPAHSYHASKPFALIHSDVWGPFKTATLSNKRWFITFIDDHTRLCWVYILTDKSEAERTFKNFCTMVETQFHEKIQVLRSDNGKEYFNQILRKFFQEKGIVHHSSCTNSPNRMGLPRGRTATS